MNLGIGIDTGGTFTDSVIVDLDSGAVLCKSKAPTTRQDLKIGVAEAFAALDSSLFGKIRLVSLSTTLATNSVVEGKGGRVGLVAAVGTPSSFSFEGKMPADEIAVIKGAHDIRGNVAVELDLSGAREAVHRMAGRVDAFAVSGYFSIYNASHERALKELISRETGLPVVCGFELSGAVGLKERAVTAVLNARLLPVIRELLEAVRHILDIHGVKAPVMVVKGDGTLIDESMAAERPVETILSGPAASIAGACRLTGLNDAVVADMGGTTTDIGIVKDGLIATSEAGAVVGGWQTRVHAVDMWTVGLGGDSKISLTPEGGCRIGPRRAVPLCVAAARHPDLIVTLKKMLAATDKKEREGGLDFYTLVRRPLFEISRAEEKLMELLDQAVLHGEVVAREIGPFVALDRFVELGYLAEVSFTPTDLMHARGELELWESAAAGCAASLLARRAGVATEELLELVHREITGELTVQIAAKALHEEDAVAREWSPSSESFLRTLLRLGGKEGVSAAITLVRPVVAVGAPAAAYFPAAAACLGAKLVVPEHAEVANAYGAVTARVVERCEVHVRPAKPDGFAVAASDLQKRFETLDEALLCAERYAGEKAVENARLKGGKEIVVTVVREEESLPLQAGWGDRVLIEVRVKATAVGVPRLTG